MGIRESAIELEMEISKRWKSVRREMFRPSLSVTAPV